MPAQFRLLLVMFCLVGCNSPDRIARKYMGLINSKHYDDARSLLVSEERDYVPTEELQKLYGSLVPLGITGTTATEGRVEFSRGAQVANQHDWGRPFPLLLKQTLNGWGVVDCSPVSEIVQVDTDFEHAAKGVAMLRDNHCDAKIVSEVEAYMLRRKGSLAYTGGSYERATEALLRSIQLLPSAEAYYQLGYVYRDNKALTGGLQMAVDAFKEAIRLAPLEATYHSSLADAYRQQSNWDGAMNESETALQLDPTDIQSRFFYSLTLWSKALSSSPWSNKWGGLAIDQMSKVAALDPNYRNAQGLLQEFRTTRGRWE